MKFLSSLTILLILISGAVQSEETVEVRDMGQMLAQVKLEKKQMEIIVDKLVSSGRLSPDNAVRAKREIASVKEEDAQQIKMNMVSLIELHQKN